MPDEKTGFGNNKISAKFDKYTKQNAIILILVMNSNHKKVLIIEKRNLKDSYD